MTRPPACAGTFYEASAADLHQQDHSLLEPDAIALPAIAIVCPHAGLMFSGSVAGAVYSRVRIPRTAILVGPNHTGQGPPLSVYTKGKWGTPGGFVSIAEYPARTYLSLCAYPATHHPAHQHHD